MDEEEEVGGGISDSELDFLKLEQGDLSPVKKSRRRSSAAKNEDDVSFDFTKIFNNIYLFLF